MHIENYFSEKHSIATAIRCISIVRSKIL